MAGYPLDRPHIMDLGLGQCLQTVGMQMGWGASAHSSGITELCKACSYGDGKSTEVNLNCTFQAFALITPLAKSHGQVQIQGVGKYLALHEAVARTMKD